MEISVPECKPGPLYPELRSEDLGSKTDLIELVRDYKELYDKNDPLYKNNSHKGVLWTSIAKSLGGLQSAKKVREQFSYMRRRFEEEYHARKNGLPRPKLPDPEAANYRKPLFVYEQLTFLEPFIRTDSEIKAELQDIENDPNTSTFFDDMNNDASDNVLETTMRQWLNDSIQNRSFKLPLGNDGGRPSNANGSGGANGDKPTTASADLSSVKSEPLFPAAQAVDSQPPAKRKRKTAPPKKSSPKTSAVSSAGCVTDSPCSLDFGNASLSFPGFPEQPAMDNDVLLQLAQALTNNQGTLDDEECSLFGRQVAMDLKKLNIQNRAIARFNINKILMELTVREFPFPELVRRD